MFASYSRKMHALPSDNLYLRKLLPSNSPCLRKAFVFAFEELLPLPLLSKSSCLCLRKAFSLKPMLHTYNASNYSIALKCICNENFDFVIFALSDNFIFSDHFNTNLVENFELEVCEFCV